MELNWLQNGWIFFFVFILLWNLKENIGFNVESKSEFVSCDDNKNMVNLREEFIYRVEIIFLWSFELADFFFIANINYEFIIAFFFLFYFETIIWLLWNKIELVTCTNRYFFISNNGLNWLYFTIIPMNGIMKFTGLQFY